MGDRAPSGARGVDAKIGASGQRWRLGAIVRTDGYADRDLHRDIAMCGGGAHQPRQALGKHLRAGAIRLWRDQPVATERLARESIRGTHTATQRSLDLGHETVQIVRGLRALQARDVDDLDQQYRERQAILGMTGKQATNRGDPGGGALLATDVSDLDLGLNRLH